MLRLPIDNRHYLSHLLDLPGDRGYILPPSLVFALSDVKSAITNGQ